MITPFFVGLGSCYYIVLAANVIRLRKKLKVSLGDGSKEHEASSKDVKFVDSKYWALNAAIRAHANFIEYSMLFYLLSWMVETNQFILPSYLWRLNIVFALGRVFHSFTILFNRLSLGFGRIFGMVFTFVPIGTLALVCIYNH